MTTQILRTDAKDDTGTVILIQDIADDQRFETAVQELVSSGAPSGRVRVESGPRELKPGAVESGPLEGKSGYVRLEVLRCADAWIWDAYGSLMRSIVASVACTSGAVEVVVVGYDRSTVSSQPVFRGQLSESPAAEAAQYLMQHVLNVHPDEWFGTGDIRQRVKQTVQVGSDHPLLPDSVQVSGFVYRPAEGVCEQI
ncbi:hypothetical protein [Alicyclobacillus sp. ALC3]|uniref:hypothetical protein n=1 Tax=Alicyclobacillus sp. ALC3 TaxID=2796143 RepID=UPI002378CC18|nr:hypothetical protein [Alicyclobacillus sp. ALC3]WDL98626.1 hypothetical protein JC200_08155 [Alicyclobacillus sp. ALC3]